MDQETDLIDFEGETPEPARRRLGSVSEQQIQSALDLLDRSLSCSDDTRESGANEGKRDGYPRRRLLVSLADDSWRREAGSENHVPTRTLDSLGDDTNFMEAILGQLLPLPSAPPPEDCSSASSSLSVYHTPPPEPVPEAAPTAPDALSLASSSSSPPTTPASPRRGWERRSRSWSGAGRREGGGEGRRSQSASGMPRKPLGGDDGGSIGSVGSVGGGEPARASMRRLTLIRDPSPPPIVLPPEPSHLYDDPPLEHPTELPQRPPSLSENLETTQPECDMAGAGSAQSPLGQWPHGLSFMLASLACTLGLFNISRFAILSVHFGGNFIIQFLLSSLILGIPLLTFHVSLGQLLAAGTLDMWRISPIFQGVGIALLFSQALIGIYSTVGVSWMFIYFRDSFITKQDVYRWSEPYDGIMLGPGWNFNTTKLEESVPDYFSGIVLQRHHLETPANTPGRLKFQVAFNLAVVWMIVFICLSKGLRSYGKVVYLFSLVPIFGMLVLCSKLLGLTPADCKLQLVFPQSDWSEFFLNTKSWTAAITESFLTWGLLGASAMQIASHNRPKHFLHRDTTLITILTFAILLLAAFLANICSQLLLAHGYLYIPSSFERMSSYSFLHPVKNPLPSAYVSTPVKWMPHNLFLAGEKVIRPGVNPRQQSGYQVLRLATELVPATLAVIGAETLSPFWSVLFYFVLILFGIAQQLAIMHCVITGIMAIKVKTMKNWETTITFFTCVCGFILGLPMTTELGIFVVYFLDYCVGGAWWIILLYLIEIGAVFMVRGRPYSGETVVATLFNRAGSWLQNWAAPMLSFTWNVILPVILMVLCITVFKNGNYKDLFRWNTVSYDYWPYWSRQLGCMIQILPFVTIPLVSLIQSCRYLSDGPPDIFDRMQLLYRPSLEQSTPPTDVPPPQIEVETNSTAAPSLATIEDPPPKYTPPPSYTTATGARIAKLLRQSFRRSVRRIANALGNTESGSQNGSELTTPLPPPPDYAAVLVEINQSLSSQRNYVTINVTEPDPGINEADSTAATSSNLSANQVAHILRSSFRRAMRDSNIVESSSSQRLVDAAVPISQDSVILDQVETNKNGSTE